MLIKNLVKSVEVTVKSGVVPFIQGSPGIGKSDIVKQVANKYKLKLIDIRLSQCDPTDLCGLPKLNGNKAEFLPFDTFPVEGDEIPKGYKGWLIFLDEINSASKAVQAAAYKLVLDKMVGNHHLHKNVLIACAGNKETDGAITNQISTALRSRFVTLKVEPDYESWLDWANDNDIDWRIISFINYQKMNGLYDFDPERTDVAYACPRSWEMVSKLLKNIDNLNDYGELLEGTVGGQAYIFINFCECIGEMPTIEQIFGGVATVKHNLDLGKRYLYTGFVINNANLIDTQEKAKHVTEYLEALGRDFAVIFYSTAIRKNPKLLSMSAIQKKVTEYAIWLTKE